MSQTHLDGFLVLISLVLGVEPRTLSMLGTHSPRELHEEPA